MSRNRGIRFYVVILLAGLTAAALTAQWGLAAEEMKGRDFVSLGKVATMEGTLVKLNAEEWALQAGDVRYDLHMGPTAYRDYNKFVLKEGSSAKVTGSVYNTDVGVMKIETEGQAITLRDDAGRPAWAGSRFSKGGSKTADNRGFGKLDQVPEM